MLRIVSMLKMVCSFAPLGQLRTYRVTEAMRADGPRTVRVDNAGSFAGALQRDLEEVRDAITRSNSPSASKLTVPF